MSRYAPGAWISIFPSGRRRSRRRFFTEVLALREEVDRLRALVQETAWWLKNNGHPVKAGLLRRELARIPEADGDRQ